MRLLSEPKVVLLSFSFFFFFFHISVCGFFEEEQKVQLIT